MSRTKRVVHLTTVHYPYDPRIYHKQCLSLQKAGYDVTLIVPGDHEEMGNDDKPINLIWMKKYSNRLLRMIVGTMQTYKRAKQLGASVYHIHDPELLPIAWLLKRKDNVVIYDIHEDYVTSILQKDYLSGPVKKVIAISYKCMEKIFSRKLALCLAEKYYKEMYPDGTCILNYPIISKKLTDHRPEYRANNNQLLYTGNVSVVRGALIHANVPHIKDNISVSFIGKCSSNLAEKMYAIADEKKEKIKIVGIDRFIKKEEMDDWYLRPGWLAGVVLFPPTDHYKKKELTKFFEYMATGLPVICSNFPVWKHLIETYDCGIAVDPHNETEIRQAIEYLQQNPEEAKRMGKNGKKAVIEQLNWCTEEEKLIEWYKKLLDR